MFEVWSSYAGWANPDRVSVMGGSHGGFLTGHLVGQYPERFVVGALLNPVVNLVHMVHVSDIPDWVFVEAFGSKVKHPSLASLPQVETMEWS